MRRTRVLQYFSAEGSKRKSNRSSNRSSSGNSFSFNYFARLYDKYKPNLPAIGPEFGFVFPTIIAGVYMVPYFMGPFIPMLAKSSVEHGGPSINHEEATMALVSDDFKKAVEEKKRRAMEIRARLDEKRRQQQEEAEQGQQQQPAAAATTITGEENPISKTDYVLHPVYDDKGKLVAYQQRYVTNLPTRVQQ